MKISTLLLALPLLATGLFGCKKDSDAEPDTGSFTIHMDARVADNAFALGVPYTKADGQTFTASTFKYYVSNFRLLRADGSSYAVPESYYLVDAFRPLTAQLTFNDIPAGEYTGISFLAGVDAPRNSAGAQTGALDPNNGMFWDWMQGYIFTKLEGSSPNSPSGAITFHVGGVSNIRTITPSFGTAKLTIGHDHDHTPSIHMLVTPLSMLESSTPANRIDFTTTYRVMDNHPAAPLIADNIAAGMFTVGHIHND